MKKLSMWRMNKKRSFFLARTLLSCCTGRKASGGIAATQHPMATRSSALFRPKWHPAVTAWRSTTSCGRLCVPKPPYMSHCFASDRTVDLRFQRSRTLLVPRLQAAGTSAHKEDDNRAPPIHTADSKGIAAENPFHLTNRDLLDFSVV